MPGWQVFMTIAFGTGVLGSTTDETSLIWVSLTFVVLAIVSGIRGD